MAATRSTESLSMCDDTCPRWMPPMAASTRPLGAEDSVWSRAAVATCHTNSPSSRRSNGIEAAVEGSRNRRSSKRATRPCSSII